MPAQAGDDRPLGLEFRRQAPGRARKGWKSGDREQIRVEQIGKALDDQARQPCHQSVGRHLERETRLRVAPYFGMSYSTYNERMRPIGGLNLNLSHGFSSIMMYDGVNVHPVVNFQRRHSVFSFILVRGK